MKDREKQLLLRNRALSRFHLLQLFVLCVCVSVPFPDSSQIIHLPLCSAVALHFSTIIHFRFRNFKNTPAYLHHACTVRSVSLKGLLEGGTSLWDVLDVFKSDSDPAKKYYVLTFLNINIRLWNDILQLQSWVTFRPINFLKRWCHLCSEQQLQLQTHYQPVELLWWMC